MHPDNEKHPSLQQLYFFDCFVWRTYFSATLMLGFPGLYFTITFSFAAHASEVSSELMIGVCWSISRNGGSAGTDECHRFFIAIIPFIVLVIKIKMYNNNFFWINSMVLELVELTVWGKIIA